MNCPVCRDPMVVLEWDRVEIDHCPSCNGTWLDRGELELLLESNEEKNQILSSFQKCTLAPNVLSTSLRAFARALFGMSLTLISESVREERDVLLRKREQQNQKSRKCPICLKKMEQIICGGSREVQIDRCVKGHGFWFDVGELEAILKTGFFVHGSKVSNWLSNIFSKTLHQTHSPR